MMKKNHSVSITCQLCHLRVIVEKKSCPARIFPLDIPTGFSLYKFTGKSRTRFLLNMHPLPGLPEIIHPSLISIYPSKNTHYVLCKCCFGGGLSYFEKECGVVSSINVNGFTTAVVASGCMK